MGPALLKPAGQNTEEGAKNCHLRRTLGEMVVHIASDL